MSRLWKSELRLELRTNVCYAALHSGGLHRRVLASASAPGRGAAAISAAIEALRMADSPFLSADARLTVADEYIDFALMPGHLSATAAEKRAKEQFAAALGHDELLVHVLPLPGRRGWLAAAIDLTDFDAWTEALLNEGVTLRHIHPSLIEDLRNLHGRIVEDDAVLVLLREEGATLIRLEDGVPAALVWERFDASNSLALDSRLRRFSSRTSERADGAAVVYMLPQSQALCRFVLDEQAVSPPAASRRQAPAFEAPAVNANRRFGVAGLTRQPEMVLARHGLPMAPTAPLPIARGPAAAAVAQRQERPVRRFLDTVPGPAFEVQGVAA